MFMQVAKIHHRGNAGNAKSISERSHLTYQILVECTMGDFECKHDDECLSWTEPDDKKDKCDTETRPGHKCEHPYKDHK